LLTVNFQIKLIIAFFFWALNAVLHYEFSEWIVIAFKTPLGTFRPIDLSTEIAIVISLTFIIYILSKAVNGSSKWLNTFSWIAIVFSMYLSMEKITTTQVEMIHFLQYGIIAWLFAWSFDPVKKHWPIITLVLLTTWLGILDELNQYFYLTKNNSTYIDFNDFVLNQIGACAGILAYYNFATSPHKNGKWGSLQKTTLILYSSLGFLILVLLLNGNLIYNPQKEIPPGGIEIINSKILIYMQREPDIFNSYIPTFSTGTYYVAGAFQGIFAMLLITASAWSYKSLLMLNNNPSQF